MITIENVTLKDNHGVNGGAIAMRNSSPTLNNVKIINNEASNIGGGMYIEGSTPVMTNIQITDNVTVNEGGGIYSQSSTVKLVNATIAKNEANYGGGIWARETSGYTSVITLQNSVIALNNTRLSTPLHGREINADISQYNFWYSHLRGTMLFYNNNVATAFPYFFTDTANGDYTLDSRSYLINRGNNAYNTFAKDLAGNTRIQQGTIDIGAFESPYTIVPNSYLKSSDAMSGILNQDEEMVSNLELSVFPNPINSNQPINISLGKYDKSVDVKLYSFNGKLIYNKTTDEGGNFELYFPDLASGIYIVHIQTQEGENFTKKIMVN